MSAINVFRYSCLGAGVVYGAMHRYNRESAAEKAVAAADWKKQERLIREAKREFARQNQPKTTGGSTAVNWEDPNLDLEAVITSWTAKMT